MTIAADVSARACALPGSPLADAAAGLDACVHCGFCLQACPTYVNLEDENDSPRGRIVIMNRLLEGQLALTDPDAGTHLDRCLGCRACETACPSGVPFGELLEATRATMAPARGRPVIARVILAIFGNRALLLAALLAARLLRATPIPALLARKLPSRMAFPFAMLTSTTPWFAKHKGGDAPMATGTQNDRSASAGSSVSIPISTPVVMLEGCVMRGLFAHVNAATSRVLAANDFDVQPAQGQACCGALHAHAGDLDGARRLARINVGAFDRAMRENGTKYIVVNSAGCGAMMKSYGHLLSNDPEWRERAESISSRTRDFSELLAEIPGAHGRGLHIGGPLELRVTHDPPCHQMHAQRVVQQPIALLGSIPGMTLVPLADADQCCGSAGIYNLIEPDTSNAVLAPKLANIAAVSADIVATGNPGCMMQIGAGLLRMGASTRVVHPAELLDASYRSTGARSTSPR